MQLPHFHYKSSQRDVRRGLYDWGVGTLIRDTSNLGQSLVRASMALKKNQIFLEAEYICGSSQRSRDDPASEVRG